MKLNGRAPVIHRPTKPPTLEEAQAMVGGYVQLVELADGSQLIVNEEGKLRGLPVNVEASKLWPVPGDLIVGDAVHLQGDARWTENSP